MTQPASNSRPRATSARLWLALCSAILAGCGANPTSEDIASLTQAVNACNESVPANRFVDGLPAYAQCTGVSSGNIWSNNGIDTSTTSGGADWIQTQRGGGYQCTEWAYRYMHFRWNVNYRNGDAKLWCAGTLPSGLVKATTPTHGDLIVFDAGVCGSDATTGHVAVVDTVNASASSVTIVEENEAGRRSTKQNCALCFLHAVANDGSVAGAGGTSGASSGGGSATAGSANGGAQSGSGGSLGSGGKTSLGGQFNASGGVQSGGMSSGGAPSGGASSGGTTSSSLGGAVKGGTSSQGGAATSGGSAQSPSGGASAGGANPSGAPSAISGSAGSPRGGDSSMTSTRSNDSRQGSCSFRTPRGDSASPLFALLLAMGLVLRRKRSGA